MNSERENPVVLAIGLGLVMVAILGWGSIGQALLEPMPKPDLQKIIQEVASVTADCMIKAKEPPKVARDSCVYGWEVR